MADPLRLFDPEKPLQVDRDPVAQWLDWEQQANLAGFRTSTKPVLVDVALVPRSELEIYVLPRAPQEIVERFVGPELVCFPRHPLNRDVSVAYFDAPVQQRWTARFTSSRTLAMPGRESGEALFSLKLATDHPHPDFVQPEKTKLRSEAIGVVDWVRVIDRVDRALGPLDDVSLVTEVLVVLVAGGESGFMVRDLRIFQDGHYYLPGLSLPFVGRQIALAAGQDFATLWGRYFAQAIGRAKARLLARYGLWYETPNPQNVVVQLDRALRPTGRLLFRDIGDCECSTDSHAQPPTDAPWTRMHTALRPETRTSFWAFGESGELSIDAETLERWYALHDDAYFGELATWFPELAPAAGVRGEARHSAWSERLVGDAAMPAIAHTFSRFRAERGPGA